jgi:predicted DCC family thiol-disulfide oxidoreductase YuxK
MSNSSEPAVLIFDGDCGFCTSVSTFAIRNTKKDLVAHAWQLVDISQFGLTKEQTAARVYLIMNGNTYSGSKAVAHLLINKKNLVLAVIGYLLVVPPFSWLAIPGYYLVAKYRHKLPGGTPACKL